MSNKKRSTRKSSKSEGIGEIHSEIQPKKDTSPYVYQKEKINFSLNIKEIPWTPRQKEIIDTVIEKKANMALIDGIWGSGKTILAVYTCLKLLNMKKISNILYVRNVVQSGTGTLGFLGGNLAEKMQPYLLPLIQKLEFLLPASQVKKLVQEQIVESQPVALLRGTSYDAYGIIIDEMGCMSKEDIMLTLSRVGKFSYVFGIGDSWQVDIKNSGFREIFNTFNDEESKEHKIYTFELQEEMDVMRSDFLRYVMKKVRGAR
jgi:phosphate starvation-inducible protein PhoH and related proteins